MYNATQLLDQPVERATRLIAIDLLENAVSARARLDDTSDTDALHHFRVSLRRLRTWLRALRPWLGGSTPKKARRRLAKAAHLTSDSRDAEVHLAWLADQRSALTARQRHGWSWLVDELEHDKRRSDDIALTKGTRAFDRAESSLARKLPYYRAHVDPANAEPPQPFAVVLAELIRDKGAALDERLTKIQSVEDARAIHSARIAGKRLRYLLEPVAGEVEGGTTLVETLAQLQDTLGNWHDARVFSKAIVAASEAAPPARVAPTTGGRSLGRRPSEQRRDLRLGLLALAGRLQERGSEGFAEAKEKWLTSAAVAEQTALVAQALAARVGRSLPMPAPEIVTPIIAVAQSDSASPRNRPGSRSRPSAARYDRSSLQSS